MITNKMLEVKACSVWNWSGFFFHAKISITYCMNSSSCLLHKPTNFSKYIFCLNLTVRRFLLKIEIKTLTRHLSIDFIHNVSQLCYFSECNTNDTNSNYSLQIFYILRDKILFEAIMYSNFIPVVEIRNK